jgi:hypothetical protein
VKKRQKARARKLLLLHDINGFIEPTNVFLKNLKSISAWVKVSRFLPSKLSSKKEKEDK